MPPASSAESTDVEPVDATVTRLVIEPLACGPYSGQRRWLRPPHRLAVVGDEDVS